MQFASLKLVEEIDESILGMDSDAYGTAPEKLFLRYMRRFSVIQHLYSPLSCYVSLGEQWALLRESRARAAHPKTISLSSVLCNRLSALRANSADIAIISLDHEAELATQFPTCATILLCPMFSQSARLICVFLATDIAPPSTSRLSDPALKNSLKALVFQLSIAYNYYERTMQHARIRTLWETFSRADLSPSSCFKGLARNVRDFLPTFGPMKFTGTLETQILMLSGRDDDRELIIRGTTGTEPPGTRIRLDRSFTGRMLRDKRLKSLCADPTSEDFRAYYKGYLGNGGPIRTELAVRLVHDNEDVGVLNLESPDEAAFNINHIEAMERLGDTIAPVLAAFEARLADNAGVQREITSSTASFLDAITKIYRHEILTPLSAVSEIVNREAAKFPHALSQVAKTEKHGSRRLPRKLTQTFRETDAATSNKAFENLQKLTRMLSVYSSEFLQDISGYSETGPIDLRATADAAARIARGTIPDGSDVRIVVESTATTKPIVFCSPLLKLHLYSLLKNAILSVVERQHTRPGNGRVTVTIAEFAPPLGEKKLNEGWSVSVWDNGVGVKADDLKLLEEFEYGVRLRKDHGSGSGLPAAQKFIVTFGGRMTLRSRHGDWFEVVMYFNKQQPKQS